MRSPHHSSRRGYISFLFMVPLALLLLMPLTLQQGAEGSLASVYPADSTLTEQVALKRALIRSAAAAVRQVEAAAAVPDAVLGVATALYGMPPSSLAFGLRSQDDQTRLISVAVLLQWSQTLYVWNQHSDYSAQIYCNPSSLSSELSGSGPAGAFDVTSDNASWSACSQLIERDRNLSLTDPLASRPFRLTPGLEVRVERKFFNYSGASPIRPQEVGS